MVDVQFSRVRGSSAVDATELVTGHDLKSCDTLSHTSITPTLVVLSPQPVARCGGLYLDQSTLELTLELRPSWAGEFDGFGFSWVGVHHPFV